jgi:hypothetical protein
VGLFKNAHLLCYAANRTAQRMFIYASRFLRALHLNIFEQPPNMRFFNYQSACNYRLADSLSFDRMRNQGERNNNNFLPCRQVTPIRRQLTLETVSICDY